VTISKLGHTTEQLWSSLVSIAYEYEGYVCIRKVKETRMSSLALRPAGMEQCL